MALNFIIIYFYLNFLDIFHIFRNDFKFKYFLLLFLVYFTNIQNLFLPHVYSQVMLMALLKVFIFIFTFHSLSAQMHSLESYYNEENLFKFLLLHLQQQFVFQHDAMVLTLNGKCIYAVICWSCVIVTVCGMWRWILKGNN